MRPLLGILSLIFAMLFWADTSSAQDLGSSNKLFGRSRTAPAKKPPAKTEKKTAPKTTTAKKRPAPKKETPAKTTAKKKSETKPKTASADERGRTATTSRSKSPASAVERARTAPVKKPETTSVVKGDRRRFETWSTPKAPDRALPQPVAHESQFERLIDDGNRARDDRDYSASESAYKRARSAKPRDARAIYGLGNLYSDQQRWEEAENAYRTALELDPKSPTTYVALSYVLIQPIAVDNLGDRYEEAEKLARRAIELAPRDALAWDQLGVAMELRGLIGPETERAYRKAIELDTSFAPAYAHLGRLLRRKGRMTESADIYGQADSLATDPPTKILVAEVLQSEQRFAESEPLLREALADDPRNPAALLLLGRALMTVQKYGDAETIFRRAADVSGNGFSANSMLATLYLRRQMYEAAENSLLRAMPTVPSYEKRQLSQQFETLGDGYMKLGRARNAERAYVNAKNLDSDKESLATKLARARRG